jgi:hypothetical protein
MITDGNPMLTNRTPISPQSERILDIDSLAAIALIKSVLDAEGVRYFLQGENLKSLQPVDPVLLKVVEEDVNRTIELMKPPKLGYVQVLHHMR